jgi:AcrR family transcriptional regulator
MRSVTGSRRNQASSLRSGSLQIAEMQRSRMLSSAVQVVSEYGYQQMSVARVAGRARVSRRTFYDVFADREDCFLAAFEDAVGRARTFVIDAYASERGAWQKKVRAGLSALLVFFDGEPGVGSLLVVDALQAGPRVLRRRAEILGRLAVVVRGDAAQGRGGGARELPPLTGEGVVGAVFSVIHTRLLEKQRSGELIELLNPLMAMIVLPYLGPAAARKELERPTPKPAGGIAPTRRHSHRKPSFSSPLAELPMRLTYRTMRVLGVIGEHPGASNRQVGQLADTPDQGQVSKLLKRLEKLGLVENATAHERSQPTGEANAWHLTPRGQEIWNAVILPAPSDPSGAGAREAIDQ